MKKQKEHQRVESKRLASAEAQSRKKRSLAPAVRGSKTWEKFQQRVPPLSPCNRLLLLVLKSCRKQFLISKISSNGRRKIIIPTKILFSIRLLPLNFCSTSMNSVLIVLTFQTNQCCRRSRIPTRTQVGHSLVALVQNILLIHLGVEK